MGVRHWLVAVLLVVLTVVLPVSALAAQEAPGSTSTQHHDIVGAD